MLCQNCETSITTASEALKAAELRRIAHQEASSVQYSTTRLVGSAREGCLICFNVLETISNLKNHSLDGISQPELDASLSSEPMIKLRLCRSEDYFRVRLDWDRPGSFKDFVLISLSTRGSDTNSPIASASVSEAVFLTMRTLGLCKHWFRTCSQTHATCSKLERELEPFVPKRLIQIIIEDDGNPFSWRVVCTVDIGNVPYLTLSHCWGERKRTCLTKDNLGSFANYSSSHALPKTYQDAFSVAFSLGFCFIWIDSLCIIQDSEEDWIAEASMMGSVYKGACGNIAATRATDGNGGCFVPTRVPTLIQLNLEVGQPVLYETMLDTFYYDDVNEARLNTRGWVVQERYLARKQLNFTSSGAYWECPELVASEQFPTGIPEELRDFSPYSQSAPPNGKPMLDLTDPSTLREAWAALVDYYSECQLTYQSDKTMALAGLAGEMRRASGDVYLAGLWKKDLAKQLCWATDFDVRKKIERLRTPMYLAPTWSWVSVDAPVTSDMRYYDPGTEILSCMEVLDVAIQSEHPSQLHSFTSSNLVVRGIAVFARAERSHRSNAQNLRHEDEAWELKMTNRSQIVQPCITESIGRIHWDENLLSFQSNPDRWATFLEERQSNFLCMLAHIGEYGVAEGLILRRLPDAIDGVKFVRMGIFKADSNRFINLLCAKLNIPPEEVINGELDLSDVRLEDIVHTVKII